jgi:hypothetical protein
MEVLSDAPHRYALVSSGGATISMKILAGSSHCPSMKPQIAVDRSVPVGAVRSLAKRVTTSAAKSCAFRFWLQDWNPVSPVDGP